MNINSNHNIQMDLMRLTEDVKSKAKDYLDDISEESLYSFIEQAKYIAKTVLENYFFEIDKLYSTGVLKIKDTVVLNQFMDFKTGYRSEMKKWSQTNEIKINRVNIDFSDYNSEKAPFVPDKDEYDKHTYYYSCGGATSVGAVGTAASYAIAYTTHSAICGFATKAGLTALTISCLSIGSAVIAAIAVELLVYYFARKTFSAIKEKRNKQYEQYLFDLEKFNKEVEKKKATLINEIIKDLKNWLSEAEKYSNQLLQSFNICK